MPELNSSSDSKARIWSKLGERVRRDFLFQAASGMLPGVTTVNVAGFNPAVGQSLEPVSPTTYAYFDRDQVLEITSSSIDDARGGVGANTLRLLGLDRNFELQMEDVSLDGADPVTTQGEYYRLIDAAVLNAGTKAGALGNITLIGSREGKHAGIVQPVNNILLNGNYTVPAHSTAYLFSYYFGMGAPKETTVGIRSLTPVQQGGDRNWIFKEMDFMYGGRISEHLSIPLMFPERTDIELVAFVNVDSTTYMSAGMSLVAIDDRFEYEKLVEQDQTYTVIKTGVADNEGDPK